MVEEKKAQYKDFDFIRTLGQGAYGEVLLAKKKDTGDEYAVKVLSKQMLQKENKQYQIYVEKEILTRLNHVGVIKLYYSFQDTNNLYLAVELCNSGDFADYLAGNFHKLDTETVQFYAAEIVLILEYLHENGIAHRDLKPENLLITQDRHLKVIDFGTALFFNTNLVPNELLDKIKQIREKHEEHLEDLEQQNQENRDRKGTFVGSPQYVSPELLETNICGPEADLWALGCILYKMFANETPFNAQNEYLVFQKVKQGNFAIPEHMPDDAQDLIKNLLNLNPKLRLGSGKKGSNLDYQALKNHPFFEGVKWEGLFQSEAPARFVQLHRNSIKEGELDILAMQQLKNDSDDDDIQSQKQNVSTWGNSNNQPLMQGIVQKKVGWMYYKKRHMILLANPPRLLYFEPDSGEKLGEITIEKDNKIAMADKSSFTIEGTSKKGKKKKYFFKEAQIAATQWVEKIKKTIESEY